MRQLLATCCRSGAERVDEIGAETRRGVLTSVMQLLYSSPTARQLQYFPQINLAFLVSLKVLGKARQEPAIHGG